MHEKLDRPCRPPGGQGPERPWETWEAGSLVILYAIGEVRPPDEVYGRGEPSCTGQGGEALPSPLRSPLFLLCAWAVSPRPAV